MAIVPESAINDLGKPGGGNGKGVGNLPGENQDAGNVATENTNPMQKHDMVGKVVGD